LLTYSLLAVVVVVDDQIQQAVAEAVEAEPYI
jgi:hypothetical protein